MNNEGPQDLFESAQRQQEIEKGIQMLRDAKAALARGERIVTPPEEKVTPPPPAPPAPVVRRERTGKNKRQQRQRGPKKPFIAPTGVDRSHAAYEEIEREKDERLGIESNLGN